MPNATKKVKIHPATYSKQLYGPIATILEEQLGQKRLGQILYDPMAGLGHGLAEIATLAGMEPFGLEIEGGYFAAGATHPCVGRGDSSKIRYGGRFAAAVTSPPYPNGMTDVFTARDDSVRHTYVHRLRSHLGPDYELHPGNSAGAGARRSAKALTRMYALHMSVWRAVHNSLARDGLFIVNVKDTPSIPFVADTEYQLTDTGFRVFERHEVATPGLNHGVGHEAKADHEVLLVCRAG